MRASAVVGVQIGGKAYGTRATVSDPSSHTDRDGLFIHSDSGRDHGQPTSGLILLVRLTSCAIMVVAPPRPDVCYLRIDTLDASAGCASDAEPGATGTDTRTMEGGQ